MLFRSPQLAVFQSADRKDVLVRYTEARAGTCSPVTRAFYLAPNAAKIHENVKPEFVDSRLADGLTPLPMLPRAKSFKANPIPNRPDLVARPISSGRGFTLIQNGRESEPYTLPSYETAGWRAAKAVLTIPAVAVDAAAHGAGLLAAGYSGPVGLTVYGLVVEQELARR